MSAAHSYVSDCFCKLHAVWSVVDYNYALWSDTQMHGDTQGISYSVEQQKWGATEITLMNPMMKGKRTDISSYAVKCMHIFKAVWLLQFTVVLVLTWYSFAFNFRCLHCAFMVEGNLDREREFQDLYINCPLHFRPRLSPKGLLVVILSFELDVLNST